LTRSSGLNCVIDTVGGGGEARDKVGDVGGEGRGTVEEWVAGSPARVGRGRRAWGRGYSG